MNHSKLRIGTLIAAVLALSPAAVLAQQSTGGEADRIAGFEATLDGLVQKYLPQVAGPESGIYRYAARLKGAVVRVKAGDCEGASAALLDIVGHRQHVAPVDLVEASYHLGECLFGEGSLSGARPHFQQVVDAGKDGAYFEPSLLRLIQISVRTDRLADAETYYRMLGSGEHGGGMQAIRYAFAKSLYEGGRYDSAFESFQGIDVSAGGNYLQAQYYIGVLYLRRGSLTEAYDIFDRLSFASLPDKHDPDLVRVKDLAWLAKARIRIDQARQMKLELADKSRLLKADDPVVIGLTSQIDALLKDAVNCYSRLTVTSAFFDQAYYEMAYANLEADDLTLARATLDILIHGMDESRYVPDARLLKGNVALAAEDYPAAMTAFDDVLASYKAVPPRVEAILEQAGIEGERRVADAVLAERQSTAPDSIARYITVEREAEAALSMTGSLDRMRGEITESIDILNRLDVLLQKPASAETLPGLKPGRREALSLARKVEDFKQTAPDGSRSRIETLQDNIARFLEDLDARAAGLMAAARQEATLYRQDLQELSQLAERYSVEARQLAGALVVGNLRDVHRHFTTLLMQAELGKVDIAWIRKMGVSRELETLVEQRSEAEEKVNRDFEALIDKK